MSSFPSKHRLWPFALLALAGCNFSVDANLTKNEGKPSDGSVDECEGLKGRALLLCLGEDAGCTGPDCAPIDAGACTGADCGAPEAGIPGCPDGVCPPPPPTVCATDAECTSDEYCAKADQTCHPRCDDRGVCAGPTYDRNVSTIVSDGSVVCYASHPSFDGFVNRADGRLMAWDLQGAVVTLAMGEPTPLFVADGYCYFRDKAGLSRALVSGGAGPELVAAGSAIGSSWLTPTHVWWTVTSSATESQLWRVARKAGAAPERFADKLPQQWETGNGSFVFRRVEDDLSATAGTIAMASLTDLSVVTRIRPGDGGYMHILATETELFLQQYRGPLSRTDLSNLSVPDTEYAWGVMHPTFHVDDQAIYWLEANSELTRFVRSPKRYAVDQDEILRIGTAAQGAHRAFTTAATKLVYTEPDEQRVFVASMAPFRKHACSNDGQCHADEACFADGLCSPRCSEQLGCAGPVVDGNGLAALGETVFWSTPDSIDSFGNPRGDGVVWSWDQETPASVVRGTVGGRLLFAADGYLYFERGDELFRVPAAGADAAEQLSTAFTKAWLTPEYIVWSRTQGQAQELWRCARSANAAAERIGSTQEGRWVASNATHAVRFIKTADPEPRPTDIAATLVVVKLPNLEETGRITLQATDLPYLPAYDQVGDQATMDSKYLYFTGRYIHSVVRVEPANPSRSKIIGADLYSLYGGSLVPSGDWLFLATFDSSNAQFRVHHRDAGAEPLIGFEVSAAIKFVVSGDKVVYLTDHAQSPYAARVFIRQLPTIPCSSTLICPDNLSCGADLLCH